MYIRNRTDEIGDDCGNQEENGLRVLILLSKVNESVQFMVKLTVDLVRLLPDCWEVF